MSYTNEYILEIQKNIGQRIVVLRKEKGISQIDLASKIEIEDSALRRIESGRTNPTLKTLLLVSNALETAGINVKSTLVKSQFEFDATSNGTAELYDINGKMITSVSYISGYNTVDVSNLNAAVYVLNFTTQEGRKAALKIIKK